MADFSETIVKGKKYRVLTDATNNKWQRISFWTAGSDVELTDGTSVQTFCNDIGSKVNNMNNTITDIVNNKLKSYVNKSGDTMTGALNLKNGTWNLSGDDAYFGDANHSGNFCIKGANGDTALGLVSQDESQYGYISMNGSGQLGFCNNGGSWQSFKSQADVDSAYSSGRTQGQNDVKNSPNSYSLYTKAQYDANYNAGYGSAPKYKDLGTGTSFNVQSVSGWQNFSADNFICEPVTGEASYEDYHPADRFKSVASFSLTKSYSNGVLTAYGTIVTTVYRTMNDGEACNIREGSKSTRVNVHAYLKY